MERILITGRPSVLAAVFAPRTAVPGTGYHVINGSVVSQVQDAVRTLGTGGTTDNYMKHQKATWLRAAQARGVPPRGWPV